MMLKSLVAMVALSLTLTVSANNKVIYGDDNRLDVYETTNALHLELARSTAGLMDADALRSVGGDKFEITGRTMEDRGYCAVTGNGTYNYPNQITAAWCSGFLVGEDILVTAGHCIRTQSACNNIRFVFDYNVASADQKKHIVSKDSVYTCKKLIAQTLDRATQNDYAIVRLDRKVTGRAPLKVRTEGKIADHAPLVVIGHPTGLPTKIAAGANVRNNTNPVYMVANLDTFGGNSGSAVFDSETGTVEGILVRGERDYVYRNGCQVPNVCKNDECRGEDVTRITNIADKITELNN